MEFEEALKEFNLTIDQFYDRSVEFSMSYIIEGTRALVFDGDCGVMVVGYSEGVVSYALVDCIYFEDFSGILPDVIEQLRQAYNTIEGE